LEILDLIRLVPVVGSKDGLRRRGWLALGLPMCDWRNLSEIHARREDGQQQKPQESAHNVKVDERCYQMLQSGSICIVSSNSIDRATKL
jgi:hypothetical protein